MANRTNSGAKHEVFNLRERVLSDDLVRAQAFAHAAAADVLRRLHLARANSKEAGGKTAVPTGTGAPPQAIVLEGLRPRPEVGTANFFVEPGAIAISFPDASPHPDDCPARLIFDGGVQTAGQLTLTPGSGSVRVDVVECQPTTVVVESDSRDVFNPATGTSSPTTLDKVTRGSLAYRIRTGTPGGGFPGVVADWLPLAVCTVPSVATTWDVVQVWDVRPLLSDLADPPHVLTNNFTRARRQLASAIEEGAGNWRVRGVVDLDLNGFKVGGELAVALSGANYLDVSSGGPHQEPGFSPTAGRPWHVFMAWFAGLPRWSKLSPASSGERTPTEPRGVPVFTQRSVTLAGKPTTAITAPAATGLGITTADAVSAVAGGFTAGGAFMGCVVGGGGWTRLFGNPGIAVSASSGNNTSIPVYPLAAGTTYPTHASALRLRFLTKIAGTVGDSFDVAQNVFLFDGPGGNVVFLVSSKGSITFDAAGQASLIHEVEVELPPNLPGGGATPLEVNVTYTNVGTFTLQSMQIVGWRLYG